jgi:hypothetical protein
MKVSTQIRLFVSIVSIVSGMLILGQVSVFAQSSDLGGDALTPSVTIRQQIVNGGFFQLVDAANTPCSGQCATPNWQTQQCSCPQGFGPIPTARVLVDVAGQPGILCGSIQYVCVLQQ